MIPHKMDMQQRTIIVKHFKVIKHTPVYRISGFVTGEGSADEGAADMHLLAKELRLHFKLRLAALWIKRIMANQS